MSVFGVFYAIVRQIPAGKVATYGQIARLAGMPRCARTVSYTHLLTRPAWPAAPAEALHTVSARSSPGYVPSALLSDTPARPQRG